MTEYTIYETATGAIVRTGATNSDPTSKIKPGQAIIFKRSFTPKSQKVYKGVLVDI